MITGPAGMRRWVDDRPRRLPRPDAALARAVRACDRIAARRLHPDDRLHRSVPAVHRVRIGPADPRRRRQRVPRLPVQLHIADPGSRPSGRRRGGRGAGPPWVGVRGTDRDGDRAGRGDPPAGPVDRTAALHELRHRGDDVRDPGGASVHRATACRQVRALVSRDPRRRHGRDARRARGDGRTDGSAAVGRPGRHRGRPARTARRPGSDHHRAGPGCRRRARTRRRVPRLAACVGGSRRVRS